jgi:hypothetical protein
MMATEQRSGAEALVRELTTEEGAERGGCWVRLPETGERCPGAATLEVYGIAFCEAHGAECESGALEELYGDADFFLERVEGWDPQAINPEALRLIRAGRRALGVILPSLGADREKLRRAWPFAEEATDPETLHFDYSEPGPAPEEWYRRTRTLIHKLMRLAHEAGEHSLVEVLERYRESTAAQLAYAIQDAERKRA